MVDRKYLVAGALSAILVSIVVAVIIGFVLYRRNNRSKIQYIKISDSIGSINLAEVEVLKNETNVALEGTVTASSTFEDDNENFGPAFLIDGDAQTFYSSKDGINSWVKINLGSPTEIDSFIISNRMDAKQDTIIGKIIQLLDSSERVIASYIINSQANVYNFSLNDGVITLVAQE